MGLLDGKSPQSISAYVITSGSMQPSIPVGSIVIAQSENSYNVGDIVTFKPTENKDHNVTHRIVGYEGNMFITKGDANQDADLGRIESSQIAGKKVLTIPYLGYLVNFAKTPQGFVILVIIPATIIVYEELKVILREIKKTLKKISDRGEGRVGNKAMLFRRAALIFPMTGFIFILTALSTSYFSDHEDSFQNVLGIANTYGQNDTSTPSPSPSPSSTPAPPAQTETVVINEFMPNPQEGNEWVEIYNATGSPVDITNWKFVDLADNQKVLGAAVIPAGGYYVFEDGTGWLNNTGEETLTLLNDQGVAVNSYTFSGTTAGVSIGRNIDGAGSFVSCLAVSKGLSNNNICALNP